MFAAVHGDRAGRVFVSSDYVAAAFDGLATAPLDGAVPLPDGTELIPLPGEATAMDRAGRPHALGTGRLALGAILPAGWVRTHHPAVAGPEDLPALPLAAVCADDRGDLRAAAVAAPATPAALADPEKVERTAREALRRWPSNRLVRQLARCARAYRCGAAAAALSGTGVAAIPVAAARNERPGADVAPRWRPDARPTEDAAFRPSAEEIAELAVAHLGDGAAISFGRACEGEPLEALRVVEDAIRLVRTRTPNGAVHAETNASSPARLRRLVAAGLGAITVPIASARGETYEAVHGPVGYRWPDVRAGLHAARDAGARVEIALLVLPGLTDRPAETDAIVALLGELSGSRIVTRDLAADPRRLFARLPRGERPIGVANALARIGRETPRAGLATV